MFEWDEAKRLATVRKHGIDFLDASQVFGGPNVQLIARTAGERRYIAVGLVDGLEVAAVFTHREGRIRIITARRARQHERAEYHAHYPGRG